MHIQNTYREQFYRKLWAENDRGSPTRQETLPQTNCMMCITQL